MPTAVLQDPWLVESSDVALQILRADCEGVYRFSTAWRVGTPNLCIVQGSTIYGSSFSTMYQAGKGVGYIQKPTVLFFSYQG